MQHRHHLVGEQTHVQFRQMVRHAAEGEFRDEMIHSGQAAQLTDLLDAIVRRADHLNAEVEIGGLIAEGRVFHFSVGFRQFSVRFITLHIGQVPVGEVVVIVDGVPFFAEIAQGPVAGFLARGRTGDIAQDDRGARGVADATRDFAITLHVLRRFRPFVLHNNQHAEAQLGHDLRRFRAHGRRIKPPFGMRDGPGADRHLGDLVEFALPIETLIRQRLDDQLRGFDKARAGFFHRDAEALVFHGRRPAAEPHQRAPAAHDIQQRDLFRDTDRVVPGQHDDAGAQCDLAGPAGIIAEHLQRRGRHGVAGKMMLQRKKGIEAQRLREIAQLHVFVVECDIRATGLGQDAERGSYFHDLSSVIVLPKTGEA